MLIILVCIVDLPCVRDFYRACWYSSRDSYKLFFEHISHTVYIYLDTHYILALYTNCLAHDLCNRQFSLIFQSSHRPYYWVFIHTYLDNNKNVTWNIIIPPNKNSLRVRCFFFHLYFTYTYILYITIDDTDTIFSIFRRLISTLANMTLYSARINAIRRYHV